MDRVDACGASDEGSNPSEDTTIKAINILLVCLHLYTDIYKVY